MTVSAASDEATLVARGRVYRLRPRAWLGSTGRGHAQPPGLDAALARRLVPYVRSLGFNGIGLVDMGDEAADRGAWPRLTQRCREAALALSIDNEDHHHDEALAGAGVTDDAAAQIAVIEAANAHPADRTWVFAARRSALAWRWAMPGRRVLNGGDEFAQPPLPAGTTDAGLAWHLLADPLHEGVQRLVHDLNRLQLDTPAALRWLEGDATHGPVLAFLRRPFEGAPEDGAAAAGAADADAAAGADRRRAPAADGKAPGTLLVVTNRSVEPWPAYRVAVPAPARFVERIASASSQYSMGYVGTQRHAAAGPDALWINRQVDSEPQAWAGCAHSVVLRLPPLSTLVLQMCR